MCSRRVSSCCSIRGTHRVNVLANPVITTNGTYPWLLVKRLHVFHKGHPSLGGDCNTFKMMTST